MEGSLHNYHEDHIARKGTNSLNHYNLVHKFIPMLQAMRIPDAKAIVDKEREKLEKIPAWQLTEVRNKKEVIAEAWKEVKIVHFASLMDIFHLKTLELDPKSQKYQGRVVLRGDTVKDDSDSHAVFTEQGSSASQMTAAKIMDIISRLPGFDGQAADAVFADTQLTMEDAPSLFKIPKSECPDIWIRLPKHKWPKSWSSMEAPIDLLERNLCGHRVAGLLRERQFEEVLLEHGWVKVPKMECLFANLQRTISVCVCGRKKNCCEETKHRTNVESTYENKSTRASQHHSLTTFSWVALNENPKRAEVLSTMRETFSNPGFQQEQKKSYLVQGEI